MIDIKIVRGPNYLPKVGGVILCNGEFFIHLDESSIYSPLRDIVTFWRETYICEYVSVEFIAGQMAEFTDFADIKNGDSFIDPEAEDFWIKLPQGLAWNPKTKVIDSFEADHRVILLKDSVLEVKV